MADVSRAAAGGEWGDTSLVGRQTEMALLRARLAAAQSGRAQFVLLRGEPGIGKTRLALHVLESMRDDGGHEVLFVPLATIRNPDLVLPAVAQALDVPDTTGGDLLPRVQALLATRFRLSHSGRAANMTALPAVIAVV